MSDEELHREAIKKSKSFFSGAGVYCMVHNAGDGPLICTHSRKMPCTRSSCGFILQIRSKWVLPNFAFRDRRVHLTITTSTHKLKKVWIAN
ncbi:hypothetical protein DsansV1_C09g0091351 [Dioscorea sansibarensis]